MPLLGWFAVIAGWLATGTLLGMMKWKIYHDDTTAKTWSVKQALRVLSFPLSVLHGWEDCINGLAALISDFKNKKERYLFLSGITAPLVLAGLLPGLVGGLLFCAVMSVVWFTTAIVQLISASWLRITKRDTAKKSCTETAITRLTELRDNELIKQESHLLEQRKALDEQVVRLRRERDTLVKNIERADKASDPFAGAYRTTLGRVENLLSAKQRELTCTETALRVVTETITRLGGIVELIGVSAYMDTIDPKTNDSSQQLLRDAYTCVEACRAIIASAQNISIGVQADTADVDELARQVDAGWTANEKHIKENEKLLDRLAEIPEQEATAQPAPRLLN
ncbi:MAG: hypothetical protein AAB375_02800 [Patescibacteria group bacterium]